MTKPGKEIHQQSRSVQISYQPDIQLEPAHQTLQRHREQPHLSRKLKHMTSRAKHIRDKQIPLINPQE